MPSGVCAFANSSGVSVVSYTRVIGSRSSSGVSTEINCNGTRVRSNHSGRYTPAVNATTAATTSPIRDFVTPAECRHHRRSVLPFSGVLTAGSAKGG